MNARFGGLLEYVGGVVVELYSSKEHLLENTYINLFNP